MTTHLAFALTRVFFVLLTASGVCTLFGFLVLDGGQAHLALRLFHLAQDAWCMAMAAGACWVVVTRPFARWRRG